MKDAFATDRVARAVRVQSQAYALLMWMEQALDHGIIQPEKGTSYATELEAGQDWIERHLLNFPPEARPATEDLEAFTRYFTSYLDCSFDLDPNPGEVLYSDDGHCFCPACSFMLRRKHLRPKKVQSADKRRAQKLIEQAVRQIALDEGLQPSEKGLAQLLAERDLKPQLSLCAYIIDVQHRMRGSMGSPASLVLWRGFTRDESGATIRQHKWKPTVFLTPDAVQDAHRAVIAALGRIAGN